MNVAFLIKEYFPEKQDVSIDVFDAHSLNDVYKQVMQKTMCFGSWWLTMEWE